MAKYQITAPDGTLFEITAPDDATEQQVLEYAQANFASQGQPNAPPAQQSFDPTEGMSGPEKFLAGVGKGFVDIGRGVGQAVGLLDQAEIDQAKALDAPLMKTGAGTAGNIVGSIAAAAPTMFIPGANTAVGASLIGAGLGAAQPVETGGSRLLNTAIGGAGGYVGHKIGEAIGKGASNYFAKKTAEKTAAKASNTIKDTAAAMGKKEGYVIPPTQANPSATNRALEGLAGKLTTGQHASAKNQAITNALAKKAIGLSDAEGITPDALKAIRDNASKTYEALKGVGQLNADDAFFGKLNSLKKTFEGAAKDFPELARPDVANVVESLKKPQFGADSAVDAIRILRLNADKAYAGGDKALGKVYKGAANAMEDLFERNLEASGNKGMLADFRDARKLIAKTYSVEKALNQSTGNVNAQKLAKMLERGKPLDKELKKAATFAQAFPKAAQEINSSLPGISPLDYATGGIASAASGNPGVMGMVVGRPLARKMILSKPYQALMTNPNYDVGLLSRMAPRILDNDPAKAISGLLGSSGSIQAVQ